MTQKKTGPPGPADETRILGDPEHRKRYVSVAELANLTPWSEQAIRTTTSRGIFREGYQYFHVRRRPVFKWIAIVDFVERGETFLGGPVDPNALVPHHRDKQETWNEDEKGSVPDGI